MSSTVRGAIDPLLGYLSSAIRDEAQLLGGVRRDAQFIKDEMESMNGFLHHLAVAGKDHEGDHHEVRAWMKQVRDLTNDTQYCVDLYGRRVGAAPRSRGVRGHARRAIFFLRTIPARHRVGKQMKELMSRARDVGERRQRYGVQVPAKVANEISGGDAAMDEELHDLRRRLVDAEPLKDATVGLINWLWLHKDGHAQEPKETVHGDTMFCSLKKCVRFLVPPVFSLAIGCQVPKIPSTILVIAIVSPDEADGGELAKEVYNHSSVASLFECKAFVTIQRPLFLQGVLRDMIRQLRRPTGGSGEEEEEEQLEDREELQKHVKGRRLLVVVENPDHPSPWNEMKEILDSSGCSPGSAIMVTTKDSVMAECFSPNETVTHSFVQYCFKKANRMVFVKWENRDIIRRVLEKCDPDLLCMKLLLGTLYADSYTSEKQLEDLCKSLEYSSALPDTYSTATSRRQHIMTKFCYDKLPMMDRCCLLYMSIFAKNSDVTRQSLERRWVAEGQVIQGDGREAMDRAQRCFDGLVARGFLAISKAGKLGNVIYCKVHPFVHDFITKVRKEDNFGNKSLPSNLAPHLSISSDIQWHQVSHQKQHGSVSSCNCFSPVVEGQGQGAADDITTFIESLPTFSRVARVKVMDLDCCEHLKNQHLKIICNNLFLLKYLSIRSTGISRLPREIKKLQQLETFDIRQTSVPSSATRGLLLPMLKHLLAGPVTYRSDAWPDKEISTVEMPSKIGEMTEMETLHYVEVVEDDKKLEHVKNLKRLRKLGVVIQGKQDDIDRLLRVITELSLCLRELSVWIRPSRSCEGPDDVVLNMEIQNKHSLYKLLEKLSIKGITKGLPNWIEDLSNLAEVTLRQTSLTDMGILGKLKGLRCLTLRHESYTDDDLILKTEEFENIKFLAIEGVSHIKRIVFEPGTAPKLEKIVWTFAKMNITKDTIIDLQNLLSLKELEFSGDFNPSDMQLVVAHHKNCPNFKYTLWRDISVQE
ncbi:hypothetical protein QYE76_013558 [Lolium multiflorum]|uniref:Rx N-terminal domain-containing protein n=1 Tax=Lolium multiflorum TaxID=4521 RepID=A0AAD8TZ29_LOLMU|nr:hypothetical protein QYE76_013558 [Lolium multiflorum]